LYGFFVVDFDSGLLTASFVSFSGLISGRLLYGFFVVDSENAKCVSDTAHNNKTRINPVMIFNEKVLS
jgi:hypothetical protein